MNNKTIYPVEGRIIHNPETGKKIVGPTVVDVSLPFWVRRLNDGDVTIKPNDSKGD